MHTMMDLAQPLGIMLVEPDGQTLWANSTLCAWLGYESSDECEAALMRLLAPQQKELLQQLFSREDHQGGPSHGAELVFVGRDGQPLPLWSTFAGAPSGQPQPTLRLLYINPPAAVGGFGATGTDQIFHDHYIGVMLVDTNLAIQKVNQAFSRITGYLPDEVVDKTPRLLQSGCNPPDIYQRMWRDIELTGRWAGEIWNRRRDGEIYAEWLSIHAVKGRDGAVRNYIGIFSDISGAISAIARSGAEKGAGGAALAERQVFINQLDQLLGDARRAAQRLAALFIHFDHLRQIRRDHGNAGAKHVLDVVVQRLRDTVVGWVRIVRWTDEEIVVLMTIDDVVPKLREPIGDMLMAIAAPIDIDGVEVRTTGSIGVSLFPDQAGTAVDLIDKADEAMYRVKCAGGNGYGIAAP